METKTHQRQSQEEILLEARKAENEAEKQFRKYEEKEDEAIKNLQEDADSLLTLGNVLSTLVLGSHYRKLQKETKEQVLQEWKEKKKEALEKRKESEEKRREAYQTMSDLTTDIQKCEDAKDIAPKTADALHQATDALRMLAATMMQTARYWEQLQEHCIALSKDEVKERVKKAMTYDEAKRHRVWTSNGFKQQAVRFYAGWVALENVCDEYVLSIREAQRELYQYITENPSYEEAGKKIHTVAQEFSKRLDEEQKAISEERERTDKEIRELDGMKVEKQDNGEEMKG